MLLNAWTALHASSTKPTDSLPLPYWHQQVMLLSAVYTLYSLSLHRRPCFTQQYPSSVLIYNHANANINRAVTNKVIPPFTALVEPLLGDASASWHSVARPKTGCTWLTDSRVMPESVNWNGKACLCANPLQIVPPTAVPTCGTRNRRNSTKPLQPASVVLSVTLRQFCSVAHNCRPPSFALADKRREPMDQVGVLIAWFWPKYWNAPASTSSTVSRNSDATVTPKPAVESPAAT
jgi:hypothetical protein